MTLEQDRILSRLSRSRDLFRNMQRALEDSKADMIAAAHAYPSRSFAEEALADLHHDVAVFKDSLADLIEKVKEREAA